MKSIIFIALFLCSAFAQYDQCPIPCGEGTNVGCPPNSLCTSYTPPGTNQVTRYCICNDGFVPTCTPNGQYRFDCNPRNVSGTTGCGSNFPNGCPSNSICVGDTPTSRRCVCTATNAILVNGVCVPQCPPYSTFNSNTQRCQCIERYIQDPNTNELRCIPGTVTCDNIQCPLGFTCSPADNTHPTAFCVASNGVPHCGVDFRCPDTRICRDSPNGPICLCPEGFGGVDCSSYICGSSNGQQTGCSVFNITAECVTTSTGESFCVCRDGTRPPRCTVPDTLCSTVDCSSIPNSRCYEGTCRCIEGYTAVPSTNTNVRFECRPINQGGCDGVVCEHNKRCALINGAPQCVCPPDTFGSVDCSKPACQTDADCTNAGLVNSYCVQSTRPEVTNFCACRPGFRGERCDIPVETCNPDNCPFAHAACNNERSCDCAPGFRRVNDTCVENTNQCIVHTLTLESRTNGELTDDELQALIAILLQIDITNIEVRGPITGEEEGTVQYVMRICGNDNVDQSTASQDLVDKINSGNDAGIGIQSVQIGDQTTGGSGAATLIVSSALVVLCLL